MVDSDSLMNAPHEQFSITHESWIGSASTCNADELILMPSSWPDGSWYLQVRLGSDSQLTWLCVMKFKMSGVMSQDKRIRESETGRQEIYGKKRNSTDGHNTFKAVLNKIYRQRNRSTICQFGLWWQWEEGRMRIQAISLRYDCQGRSITRMSCR